MEVFHQMLSLQLQLFILIALGVLARKLGLIDGAGRKTLSGLLINVILPCNIVNSFLGGTGATGEFIRNCALIVGISAVIEAIAICLNRVLFRRYASQKANVMSYGMLCSNSSFIGLPVADALYGGQGVMYASFFTIPVRLIMWTAGLSLFTQVRRREALKNLATHPCILAVLAGVVLMVLPVRLPQVVSSTVTALSRCTIPISMLVIGSILADADVKSLLSKTVLYFTILRLIVFPLGVYAVLSLLPIDPLLVNISVLMTGMPAGSTTSILADRYGADSLFASQIVFASTLCSVVTLPLLCLIL